jgi:hypothetical protein
MTDGRGDEIQRLLTETKEHCKPMKHLRDKTVGHNDLNTKLKYKENPLPGIGRSEVEKSLTLISADHLMFYLKRGLEAPDPDLEKYR